MKTKSITIRKPSGFQYSITASILDTPKGDIRTIELIDHEVRMTDKEPTDSWVMTFNENSLDTNTKQLKELCEFILEAINKNNPVKSKEELLENALDLLSDAIPHKLEYTNKEQLLSNRFTKLLKDYNNSLNHYDTKSKRINQ